MTTTVPSFYDDIDLRDNWRTHSICGPEHDAVLYSPNRKGYKRDRDVRAAQQICEQCPVQQQCLNVATERNEKFGVWGGKDFSAPSPRTVLRKRTQEKTPTDRNTNV